MPEVTGSAAQRTASMLVRHGAACAQLGSRLYGDLLAHAAGELLAGGPVAAVLDGYLGERLASAVALRLLAGVHALVLAGRAPALAAYYPSAGGAPELQPGSPAACAAFTQVLSEHGEHVRAWLTGPPQTNEPGRAAALLGGLRHVAAQASLPVRLVEVGASAGLNLRADRFFVSGPAGRHGDESSPVQLTGGWQGAPLPASTVELAERTGGDLSPVDPLTPAGQLRLTAYVWPDQAARLARLRGALDVAARLPAPVRAESATATLAAVRLVPGTWTVVWHSIFRQYLSTADRAELASGVAQLAGAATPAARFAYLYLEQSPLGGCRVTLATWPGGQRRDLGSAPAHGLPVRWLAQR